MNPHEAGAPEPLELEIPEERPEDGLRGPLRFSDFTKLPLLIVAAMFIAAAILYPSMPQTFPTHWGADGVANGWATKSILSVFMQPFLALLLYGIVVAVPFFDPKRANLRGSIRTYNIVLDAVTGMEAVVWAATTAAAFNHAFDVSKVVLIATGVLFMVLGKIMTTVKQNHVMGVRLRATLADEFVWRKTNRLGGYLFVAMGVVTVVCAFIPAPLNVGILLVALMSPLIVLYVYAERLYRSRHPKA